jgi:hypothetical protein
MGDGTMGHSPLGLFPILQRHATYVAWALSLVWCPGSAIRRLVGIGRVVTWQWAESMVVGARSGVGVVVEVGEDGHTRCDHKVTTLQMANVTIWWHVCKSRALPRSLNKMINPCCS